MASVEELVAGEIAAQVRQLLIAMQETPVPFLGWEDLLEKG